VVSVVLVVAVLIAAGLVRHALPLVVLLAVLLALFLAVNLFNASSRRAFSLWKERDYRRRGDASRGP
jgi:hypothetical protein